MEKKNEIRSQCSICGKMDSCEYVKTYGPERAYCDGIEKILSSLNVDIARSATKPDEQTLAKYKGLCSNCDNRHDCMFPKPEGGVWHCEEYC